MRARKAAFNWASVVARAPATHLCKATKHLWAVPPK